MKKDLPRSIYTHGFAHIFLLITVLSVGIVGIGYFAYKNGFVNRLEFYINPTIKTDGSFVPPNDWQTYNDKYLNFVIKHPNWIKVWPATNSEYSKDETLFVEQNYDGQPQPPTLYFKVAIEEYNNPEVLNLEIGQTFNQTWGSPFNGIMGDRDFTRINNIVVDGIESKAFKVNNKLYKEKHIDVYIPKEGRVYVITLKGDNKQMNTLVQILSTFEFLEQDDK